MTFENMVARFRKCCEHRDELQDIIDALKGECDSLEAQIIEECLNDPSHFDVYKRKNQSAGLIGRNFFKVTFSKTLMRKTSGERLDDQDWLGELDQQYTRSKMSLSASKVNADYKEGTLTDADLRDMDLAYGDTVKLTASLIPDDTELEAIKAQAQQAYAEEE